MLAGEYAVLYGARALAVTIDRRLNVTVEPLTVGAKGAAIASDLWEQSLTLTPSDLTSFDLARVKEPNVLKDASCYAAALFGLEDFKLTVESQLDVRHGVGSSSALRVGVLMAMKAAAGASDADGDTGAGPGLGAAHHAWILQRAAQSMASGYDGATQVLGGLVEFQSNGPEEKAGPMPADSLPLWPVTAARLPRFLESARELVHPFAGGRGAPTGKVLRETLAWLDESGRLESLLQISEGLVEAFMIAFDGRYDERRVLHLVNAAARHRELFDGSPHHPLELERALSPLPGFDRTWTFKTSGAGGEDALLLLGEARHLGPATEALYRLGWDRMKARFAESGATASTEMKA